MWDEETKQKDLNFKRTKFFATCQLNTRQIRDPYLRNKSNLDLFYSKAKINF